MSSLKHPYTVAYYESFEENGKLAIIMDYAEGGDLAGRITRQSNRNSLFSEGQLVRWATQILLGLKHLNIKRIIHRDLKPCNIFLTKEGDARLGDFGLSKILDDVHEFKDEFYIGTPSYFSPEIFAERLYSSASDVWVLGCVLHELGTFRIPFEASDFKSLYRKVAQDPVPVLPQAFSEDMRQVCRDLMYWDYRKRPTVSELVRRPMIRLEVRNLLLRSREESPAESEQSASEHHISTADDFEAKPIMHVPKRVSASMSGCPSVLSKAGSKALISSASCLKVASEFNDSKRHTKTNDVISPVRQKSCTPVFSRRGVGCGPRASRCRSSAVLVLQG
jgi:serine/threonine protein kinase